MSGKMKQSGKEKRRSLEEEGVDARIDSCMVTMRGLRELAEKEANLVQSALRDMEKNLIDPGYILDLTKSIHGTGSRNVSDYIKRNTEILLNEHATVVRQKVIQKMKQQIKDMNEEMSKDAKKLGEDISNFFEFIQSSYELASDSFKRVKEIAKKNYEKVELINETHDKLFSLQSELHELEQQLLECLMCSEFLKKHIPEGNDSGQDLIPKEFLRSFGPKYSAGEKEIIQKEMLENILKDGGNMVPVDVNLVSSGEVTKVIERLKNSNLSLVHNSNLNRGSSHVDTTELAAAQQRMIGELAIWDEKIADAKEELKKTKQAHEKLKMQTKEIEEKEADKNRMQKENELQKLTEMYHICTGSKAKITDLILMRDAIDHSIEQLLNEINKYPRKKVKELLKTLEAEKKLSERKAEETLRAQRATERLKKASSPTVKKDQRQTKHSK